MELQLQLSAEPKVWDPVHVALAVVGVVLFMIAVYCLIGQYQIVQHNPCAATLRQTDQLCNSPEISHN